MKKRKGHSIHKRHAAYSRALLHRLSAVVLWVAGQNDNKCILVSLKTGKAITIGPELYRAIDGVQHDWATYCAVFGRRQDGEEYMQGATIMAPRCYQSQIATQLGEIHTEILRGMNPQHRVGIGWIGCPWGQDISEADAGRLFEMHDGWSAEKIEIKEASAA
ncbi:hypothetical protein GCM10011348_46390 [Marinobacterium nitratireducens]|uniref:Uncharacterized protein n=1 Tax=Marinobacterium nitratireducens TaxID=518897 RepID=A0A917ZRI3_9GAMM|nr:hypothetical protein [Marinobacterium nitratireducens]GGO89199.1 hypothetical protein GCM10011348_46390 [Marinobacterium nitratireducens]